MRVMTDKFMRVVILLFVLTSAGNAEAQTRKYDHGEQELAKILDDRPEMKGILPEGDIVLRWVIRKLQLGLNGEKVHWDNTDPEFALALNRNPTSTTPRKVCITSSSKVSGHDKWYLLVFELSNLMHPLEIKSLQDAVISGRIDRNEFAHLVLRGEYARMIRANRFFRRNPLPGADPENAPLYTEYLDRVLKRSDLWNARVLSDAEITQLDDYTQKMYSYYGRWYDHIAANRSRTTSIVDQATAGSTRKVVVEKLRLSPCRQDSNPDLFDANQCR